MPHAILGVVALCSFTVLRPYDRTPLLSSRADNKIRQKKLPSADGPRSFTAWTACLAMGKERASTRDAEEIAELDARALAEAPELSTNPLHYDAGGTSDAQQLSAGDGKVRYGKARRFSELPISRRTLAGLAKAKWEKMTDIQRAALPHALAGRDILGAAKTGSGKTLAFVVPLLERLYRLRWGVMDGLGGLIISPTRELALQIFEVLRAAGAHHTLSAGLVRNPPKTKNSICAVSPSMSHPQFCQMSELEFKKNPQGDRRQGSAGGGESNLSDESAGGHAGEAATAHGYDRGVRCGQSANPHSR